MCGICSTVFFDLLFFYMRKTAYVMRISVWSSDVRSSDLFEGTMLPVGEHKGAAMSWMMDVLAGVFTGGGFGGDVANPFNELDRPQGTGHVFMAFKADLFCPMTEFAERMAELDRRPKPLPNAEGVERIRATGAPEIGADRVNRAQRRK